jgi:hypothetical protein
LCKSLLYYGEEANKEPIERLFLDLRAWPTKGFTPPLIQEEPLNGVPKEPFSSVNSPSFEKKDTLHLFLKFLQVLHVLERRMCLGVHSSY